jgi:hypothetical protein
VRSLRGLTEGAKVQKLRRDDYCPVLYVAVKGEPVCGFENALRNPVAILRPPDQTGLDAAPQAVAEI